MSKYRNALPQLSSRDVFITDGGIETDLIFHHGMELPSFASFVLLQDEKGSEALRNYFRGYAEIARNEKVGLVLEAATWRSNPGWGKQLGYSENDLEEINRKAIDMLVEFRKEYETEDTKVVISGCLGPRGDGYSPSNVMSAQEAEKYHSVQINTFKQTEADLVTAITMNYVEEALGIAQAAKSLGMPVVISFTVETDGKLPTGQTLKDAIEQVDKETGNHPAYYMINCAHPSHFADVLESGEAWAERIGGIRANASKKSHAELDFSVALDEGNPAELGQDYIVLFDKLKNLTVLGGCCGTDARHIAEICKSALQHRNQVSLSV
ncbi:MAG TPA: homocysteine S-methyltransferase family protein [Anaerolineales bacterium]|nr:homocysteine S-methyltransferase family protein [Anaerolineales bacterium]